MDKKKRREIVNLTVDQKKRFGHKIADGEDPFEQGLAEGVTLEEMFCWEIITSAKYGKIDILEKTVRRKRAEYIKEYLALREGMILSIGHGKDRKKGFDLLLNEMKTYDHNGLDFLKGVENSVGFDLEENLQALLETLNDVKTTNKEAVTIDFKKKILRLCFLAESKESWKLLSAEGWLADLGLVGLKLREELEPDIYSNKGYEAYELLTKELMRLGFESSLKENPRTYVTERGITHADSLRGMLELLTPSLDTVKETLSFVFGRTFKIDLDDVPKMLEELWNYARKHGGNPEDWVDLIALANGEDTWKVRARALSLGMDKRAKTSTGNDFVMSGFEWKNIKIEDLENLLANGWEMPNDQESMRTLEKGADNKEVIGWLRAYKEKKDLANEAKVEKQKKMKTRI